MQARQRSLEPHLIIASEEDTRRYEECGMYSGLPSNLAFLSGDITAIAEKGGPGGMDHVHLSICDNHKHLVRWTGRASNGWHYPIGRVMVILNAAHILYPGRPEQ